MIVERYSGSVAGKEELNAAPSVSEDKEGGRVVIFLANESPMVIVVSVAGR